MPRKAAVVNLEDWLPPCLVSARNHPEPEASGILVAPRHFDVNMAERRILCRRTLRNGLGKKVHSTSSPSHLSGGTFCVPKDLDWDRFIGDRRPRNGSLGSVICLGLLRLMLPSDCVIRIHFRNVSDCYYACSVDEKRLQRQVLGPRVPVSWFSNLDGFEPWVPSDLVQNPIQETVDPCRYCQIAVAAVIMGDLNTVYAVEAAFTFCPEDLCKLERCCSQIVLFSVLPRKVTFILTTLSFQQWFTYPDCT